MGKDGMKGLPYRYEKDGYNLRSCRLRGENTGRRSLKSRWEAALQLVGWVGVHFQRRCVLEGVRYTTDKERTLEL